VSLPKLAPGKYRISWQAVAVDTHRTSGTFDFTIQ
jgi:methionine-rich copper-binding protein CopC